MIYIDPSTSGRRGVALFNKQKYNNIMFFYSTALNIWYLVKIVFSCKAKFKKCKM